MTPDVPIKTARTTLEVVETLLELDGATFSEIADEMEMPKSTLHDHLRTLELIGVLVHSENEYRVGTWFLNVGHQVRHQRSVYEYSQQEVDNLAEKTGEHASLMIEENGEGVLLYIAKGEDAVDLNAWAGRRIPLSAQAPGKAILAHSPEERVDAIIDEHGLPQFTDKTITNREALDAELERIRERGYATDNEELIEGVKAISAPIFDRGTIAGAVTVGGPANRMAGEWFDEELPDLLLQSSNVIELNLSTAQAQLK
ncbi:MAG: IclR family transcriptional regulator [Halovenus sp.]